MVLGDGEQAIEALVTHGRNAHNGHCSAPRPPVADGLREIGRRGAQEAERNALVQVLDRVCWNLAEAARILKVGYKTLRTKISEYGLSRLLVADGARRAAIRPGVVARRPG